MARTKKTAEVTFTDLVDSISVCGAVEESGKASILEATRSAGEALLAAHYAEGGPVQVMVRFLAVNEEPSWTTLVSEVLIGSDDDAELAAQRRALYNRLTDLARVARRFPTRPPRFTTWKAIVRSLAFSDEQIERASDDALGFRERMVEEVGEPALSNRKSAPPRRTTTTPRQTGPVTDANIDATAHEFHVHLAKLVKLYASHVESGGAVDADIAASIVESCRTILG